MNLSVMHAISVNVFVWSHIRELMCTIWALIYKNVRVQSTEFVEIIIYNFLYTPSWAKYLL